MDKENALILWFDQITIEDVPCVGGKNASLGEMYQALTGKGVRVPNGFAVTAGAYRHLLTQGDTLEKIKSILADLDTGDMDNLAERGRKVRTMIRNLEFPDDLRKAVIDAYRRLEDQYGKDVDVAVRSSATAEDLPDASFAGQQETYLNIHGAEDVIEACGRCFASLFTNRAISYRVDKGFDHFSIALSIAVQKMVRSDLAASGVMFSIDTETGFKDAVYVTGAYGLGENVVQGAVNPDEWYVFKPTLKKGFKPIIMRKVGEKAIKMVYTEDAKQPTKNVPVPDSDRRRLTINDCEVLELARMACVIEDHYSSRAGHLKPMDIEWAKDGLTGELYIVQARPETVHAIKDLTKLVKYVLKTQGEVIVAGKSVGERIGRGQAHIIKEAHMIKDFRKGEVLVTDMTDPDWEPIMKIAAAIVTNRGGRTCHAAIVSRELGIPCIVGTGNGADAILDGEEITVDCSQGSTGYVYRGLLDFEVQETDLASLPRTKTKITMNLASPEQAFEKSFIPNDGVGLAREEFIINSYIRVHPLALLRFGELKDTEVKRKIYEMTRGYENKADFFVEKLAEGVGMIAAAFYPKPVIVRLSDFKSNEYANLIGGAQFEPSEDNPMIGWRGASRYYDPNYKEAFALECRAMRTIRDEMGLTNVEIMIPFPRTVGESRKVLATMAEYGLKQGENGLRVIGMCEIPSNVILADEFLDVFDGFSIGSNDLTQLILGVDRDSELVAHVYDERNEAVKRMVKQVIEVARRKNKYIGICGQAPSDYIEFAEFLVECGIQSMSLNPDTVIKTTLAVAALEKRLGVKA
ncbi:phosphoenolpyruvate synthase [Desulfolutivibrio sulfoxidireducens]|uniref:phosphoenolpyruvate synthase n=1 Tax=Desulfolutivibrio sulfoxidireducens TaxID=2773299 RepID=UPI00159E287B|nr:phosphoenolpyruvate synthase [Desulfolutivibrio sulfoxidireducens]QLA15946.1 phosphoenolpyruvate synthase [Desulfolutivibrio sulfoxidireducens]QLA20154.1 phosphoenolpyruvate synthase [Desulfolutivibrio sulfoxidireducens]